MFGLWTILLNGGLGLAAYGVARSGLRATGRATEGAGDRHAGLGLGDRWNAGARPAREAGSPDVAGMGGVWAGDRGPLPSNPGEGNPVVRLEPGRVGSGP